jgi:hypothetical protein
MDPGNTGTRRISPDNNNGVARLPVSMQAANMFLALVTATGSPGTSGSFKMSTWTRDKTGL